MTQVTWHRGIGADITSDMSVDDQLEVAGLDWEVRTSPISYGNETRYDTDKRKAIYRADTGTLFDVASDRWTPFQNREIVETFHNFCGQSDLTIAHLGLLQGGRTIFAGADLKRSFDVKQVGDIVRGRLLLFNYHAVGYGLVVKLHLERLICTNGMTQPVRVGNRTIGHVGGFNSNKVLNVLQSTISQFENFGRDAEQLANAVISREEAQLILIKEFGDPKLPLNEQPAIVQTCLNLFLGGAKGADMLSAYNTAWGLLNAFTETMNHRSTMRGGMSGHVHSLWNGSKAHKQANFMQTLVRVSAR